MANSINEKSELIQKWKMSIEKLNRQILQIQSDTSLAADDRQKKIAHRQNIIDGYSLSIKQAEEYIERETLRTHQIYEHQMNKMK